MRNRYSVSEFIGNAIAYVLTKVFYSRARFVRRPVYIRGRKSMTYGEGLTLGHGCRFDLPGDKHTLSIGAHCEFGDYVHIVAFENVIIGDDVLMASKIFISDTNHGTYTGNGASAPHTKPNDRPLVTVPTYIGSNVWIGENAVILPGTKIGDGCVIGANSVVKGEIPPNCIAVGTPARIVKRWYSDSKTWIKANN